MGWNDELDGTMNQSPSQVVALFEAALERGSAEERARFLDRECPDAALRQEVEALLAAHDKPDSLFADNTVRVECYVHFLLGFEAMGEGRSPSAKGHLEAALATDVIGGPSYTCAQVALAQLGRHPDWPAIKPDKPPR